MLPPDTIATLARQLYQARKTRTQLRHFSRDHPQMTIEDGYAIQRAWVQLELADGRRICGRKIGLTSRAMQQASQITEPDYAPLMDDMFFASGTRHSVRALHRAARRGGARLRAGAGSCRAPASRCTDVLRATAYVTPALEIIDARIEQFDRDTKAPRKVFDTIADFAANAGIVLGGRPVRADAVDLRWVGALLYKNAVIEETGLAAAVLNHPATGVAWLANKIAPYDERLSAGDVVLAGSFTRPTAARAGDVVHADFGPLGNIALRFT